MRQVTAAAVQMSCTEEPSENIAHADALVREAAKNGAQVILLPELFERQYFCQERRYDYYGFASPVNENEAVKHFAKLAAELSAVLPISFYERENNSIYNSAAIIDADGSVLGVYRKTHIPDDHYYQEKFYFTPGNTGFKVWQTRYCKIGVGICWDQWFPEAARCMALDGAELLLYPTAIGSEPIIETDSMPHWRRTMQGHAAANIVPVIAANRYGRETVVPSKENGGQSSALEFYGSSFITDELGDIIKQSDRSGDDVIASEFSLDEIAQARFEWGLFRDRRPEMYGRITQ